MNPALLRCEAQLAEYPDVTGLRDDESAGEPADDGEPGAAAAGAAWSRAALVIAVPMLLLALQAFTPAATASLLEFDRTAIRSGELWRLLTAHWIHVDFAHALQNAVALAGLLLFAQSPRQLLRVLLIATPLLGLALWWLVPGLQALRGASGLLFVGLVWLLVLPHQGRWEIRAAWRNALWLVLACKLLADAFSLVGLLPRAGDTAWVVAGEAHLLGAFIGWQLARSEMRG